MLWQSYSREKNFELLGFMGKLATLSKFPLMPPRGLLLRAGEEAEM